MLRLPARFEITKGRQIKPADENSLPGDVFQIGINLFDDAVYVDWSNESGEAVSGIMGIREFEEKIQKAGLYP